MNNPHPLIPQGSLLEQKNQGRARVRLAVSFVLIIHVVGLMALLIQGCRREQPVEPEPDTSVMNVPIFEPTNTPVEPMYLPPTNTGFAADPPFNSESSPALQAPMAGVTEYVVVRGDNFTVIGKKFGVSASAIQEANPGIDPLRLQIGQRLLIPPPSQPPVTAPMDSGPALAGGEQIYTVVSGDNLIRIAAKFNTTVRALRSANNLTTDRILVGQKLRIPVSAPPEAPTTPPSNGPVPNL